MQQVITRLLDYSRLGKYSIMELAECQRLVEIVWPTNALA